MKQLRAAVSDAELCAYLDGELSQERRAEVEAWLTHHPEARSRLAAWRRQELLVRASFGRIAQEPIPACLAEPLRAPRIASLAIGSEPALRAPGLLSTPVLRRRSVWRRLAVAVACLGAAAGIFAWFPELGAAPSAIVPQAPGSLIRHAGEAHAAFAPLGERVMDARSGEIAALAEAARRSGLHIRVPAAVNGLRPLGLRLTPGDGGLAALVLYASDKIGPVSLYVSRGAVPHAGIILREAAGGARVAAFTVDGYGYALTGAASRDQMVDWASALRATLVQPRSLRGS